MESLRQVMGVLYFALAEAAGGDAVLDRANDIILDAVAEGAVSDIGARHALLALVRSSDETA